MEEFNLSDRRTLTDNLSNEVFYYLEEDVKEFIKRLKDETIEMLRENRCECEQCHLRIIDKLAGPKLT